MGQVQGPLRNWSKRIGNVWGIFGEVGQVQVLGRHSWQKTGENTSEYAPSAFFSSGASSEDVKNWFKVIGAYSLRWGMFNIKWIIHSFKSTYYRSRSYLTKTALNLPQKLNMPQPNYDQIGAFSSLIEYEFAPYQYIRNWGRFSNRMLHSHRTV